MSPQNGDHENDRKRLCLDIEGSVQGVGFRPFVYRLATSMGLTGTIGNTTRGVTIEIEGRPDTLDKFIERLHSEKPPLAKITNRQTSYQPYFGDRQFTVRQSLSGGVKSALVLPDIATCDDCRKEIFDSANRRYRYPFTNCTNCGPRYSIIDTLPYDRHNTTMKIFPMCDACLEEYENPADRRFHAQPNACPVCGPHLELWNPTGEILSRCDESLLGAADALKKGAIVALKGLGGFQLIVDARNDGALEQLRKRKGRRDKPFAMMYPSLEAISEDCELTFRDRELLTSPQAPIVLVAAIKNSNYISSRVAPDNPCLGVMLPYTPLHHLLMHELKFPIVATSGNISEEPISIDEYDALDRLGRIADLFLVHNRPIARQVDDSLVRVMSDQPTVLRNARGFAPVTVNLRESLPTVLATGAHLKNTIAYGRDHQAILSQHIGDLETSLAFEAHRTVTDSLAEIYDFTPTVIACDLHPDYLSTRFAEQRGLPTVKVQHHYAHVLAGMADNQLDSPVLGVAWDGTGLGLDSTIWGGEFLRVNDTGFTREAHLRTFSLPGGHKAVLEPRRSAVGLLYEIFGDKLFDKRHLLPLETFYRTEKDTLNKMLTHHINTPRTSSAGRLFDAVASLIGLAQVNNFESQAAMRLEFEIGDYDTDDAYPFSVSGTRPLILDWEPTVTEILADLKKNIPAGLISARFHNTLIAMISKIADEINLPQILLTGGCFQNRCLTEKALRYLTDRGFQVYRHRQIPPNDGGIALGQLIAVSREYKNCEGK
ncbi:MAG: carbamoyltransferase HypF [Candidatus Zixiibacteriota bacterium]